MTNRLNTPLREHLRHPVIVLALVALSLWALGALIMALAPILSPFLIAAIFAYIGNPLVGLGEQRRVPRSVGALLVILGFIACGALLVGVLIPLLQKEALVLAKELPRALASLQERILPWAAQHFGVHLEWNVANLKTWATSDTGKDLFSEVWSYLFSGGTALVGLVGTLFLTPVVMFYLLRDWPALCERIASVIPRPMEARINALAGNIDRVLAEFLRGQIAVMLCLALFYSVALWLVGMDYALPVGLITGLLVFVPYVGFAAGLALSLLVSLQQGWPVWALVIGVFGLGQILESFVLTPRLVGERIGLHPVAVIFALMAFGQLFGFVGVLLALPASAVLLVALREVRLVYLRSDFYRGR
ncbi:MAG: hypothetical protein RIR70_316 [Pseudomonadota bacterium]|jgi:predicted PurR-regulated permease PerM